MPVLRASPRLRESPLTLRVFVAFIAVSTCHPLGYIVVIEFEVELIAEKKQFRVTIFSEQKSEGNTFISVYHTQPRCPKSSYKLEYNDQMGKVSATNKTVVAMTNNIV